MFGQSPLASESSTANWEVPGTTTADWVRLVRGEYLEIPGLLLTDRQIQRLWGLDPATCGKVVETLIDCGFLRQTYTGAYVRASDGRS